MAAKNRLIAALREDGANRPPKARNRPHAIMTPRAASVGVAVRWAEQAQGGSGATKHK